MSRKPKQTGIDLDIVDGRVALAVDVYGRALHAAGGPAEMDPTTRRAVVAGSLALWAKGWSQADIIDAINGAFSDDWRLARGLVTPQAIFGPRAMQFRIAGAQLRARGNAAWKCSASGADKRVADLLAGVSDGKA